MSRPKDILFFSNECDYCKEVLTLLLKKNIRDTFMIINVDKGQFQLPSFVDRVPLIYTLSDQVLFGDALDEYVGGMSSVVDHVMPFSLGVTGGEISDGFSYLEDMNDLRHKGYTLVGMDQKITSVNFEENTSNEKSKFDSSIFDRFVKERDSDQVTFKRSMNINASPFR